MQFSFDYAPPSSPEEERWRLTRDLPDDQRSLLSLARRILAEINTAASHGDSIAPHATKLEGIASKLGLDDDALDAQIRAPLLKIPLWGQRGDFVLSAKGCRSWVHLNGLMTSGLDHYELRPVDYDLPWLTPYAGGYGGRLPHPGPLVKSVRKAIGSIVGARGRLYKIEDAAPNIEDFGDNDNAEDYDDYWLMKAAWGEEGWLRQWLAEHPPA